MIDRGRRIRVAEVSGWYYCGKVETVLETNLHLLRHGRALAPEGAVDVVVEGPVRVEPGAVVERSTIGPNVTIETGAVVRDSVLRHTIVSKGAQVLGSTLDASLVGDDARVEAQELRGMVVAKDEVAPAP